MINMRFIVFFLLMFFSWTSLASAQCYRFANLKGYSMRATDQYKLSEDGFSGQVYEIILDDNPRVIGS